MGGKNLIAEFLCSKKLNRGAVLVWCLSTISTCGLSVFAITSIHLLTSHGGEGILGHRAYVLSWEAHMCQHPGDL